MPKTKKVKIECDENVGYVYYVVFRNDVTGHETVEPYCTGFVPHAMHRYKESIIGEWTLIPTGGYRGISRDSNYTHIHIRGLVFLGPRDLSTESDDESIPEY